MTIHMFEWEGEVHCHMRTEFKEIFKKEEISTLKYLQLEKKRQNELLKCYNTFLAGLQIRTLFKFVLSFRFSVQKQSCKQIFFSDKILMYFYFPIKRKATFNSQQAKICLKENNLSQENIVWYGEVQAIVSSRFFTIDWIFIIWRQLKKSIPHHVPKFTVYLNTGISEHNNIF